MSTLHWIQTSLEVVIIAALVLGFIYEPALAKWEQKLKGKVLKAFKDRKEYRR